MGFIFQCESLKQTKKYLLLHFIFGFYYLRISKMDTVLVIIPNKTKIYIWGAPARNIKRPNKDTIFIYRYTPN